MKIARFTAALPVLAVLLLAVGCGKASSGLKDGYFTAEESSFDEFGWKEFITIYVSNGRIITVEYDAFNKSGFVKSWDIDYMRRMKELYGTYPNEYARTYTVSLINWQSFEELDSVSGATSSYNKFQILANTVIEQAKTGSKDVVRVDFEDGE